MNPSAVAASSRPRALHLIDIENLVGSPLFDCSSEVRVALHAYRTRVRVLPGDAAVIATAQTFAPLLVGIDLAGMQLRVAGNGPDAADHVLLNAAPIGYVASRFGLLVIASGDGIFTDIAVQAANRGMTTWLVTGRGACAARLRASCAMRTRLVLPRRTIKPSAVA